MKLSRKLKLIVVSSVIIVVLIIGVSWRYVQLTSVTYVSLEDLVLHSVLENQNLNTSSPMYGSFFNASWSTMQAIDLLAILGGLDSVNKDAAMQFLIGANESGPADRPMQNEARYNIDPAFIIGHTASVLGRLKELPALLVSKIGEVIKAHQNSTSKEVHFWWADRPSLFELARLFNQSAYVELTLQRQDIFDDLDKHVSMTDRELSDIYLDVKALEELQLIDANHTFVGYVMPDATRHLVQFYILSLWDDVRYGFYASYSYYYPQYYEPSLWQTSSAVQAYFKVTPSWELDYLQVKVGSQYEKLLSFLKKCQNQYGVFFDSPGEIDESHTIDRMSVWSTYYAVALLKTINRLDFLNEKVVSPAQ